MLKKVLIIIGIILLIGFVSAFVRGCNYNQEKSENKTTPTTTETEKQNIISEENISNILDDSNESEKKTENIVEDQSNNNQTETTTTNKKETNNNNTSTKKEETKTNIESNNKKEESSQVNSSNTEITNEEKETNKQEDTSNNDWEDFINDPAVINSLGGYVTKFTSDKEAKAKKDELTQYGYYSEWIKNCMDPEESKCAYGVIATVPANVCENNPEIKYQWWLYDNYVDIITYLKSIGYACEGKQW